MTVFDAVTTVNSCSSHKNKTHKFKNEKQVSVWLWSSVDAGKPRWITPRCCAITHFVVLALLHNQRMTTQSWSMRSKFLDIRIRKQPVIPPLFAGWRFRWMR